MGLLKGKLCAWQHQTNSNPPPAITVYLESSGIGFACHLSGMEIYILSALISSVENVHCLKIKNIAILEVDLLFAGLGDKERQAING